jgi:hypothetical protein
MDRVITAPLVPEEGVHFLRHILWIGMLEAEVEKAGA